MESFSQETKLELISDSAHKVIMRVKNASDALINTFRQYLISETPSLAIDFVEILSNESPLPDELLAHRLGLLPLLTIDPAEFVEPMQCSCSDYCSKCAVLFAMDFCATHSAVITSDALEKSAEYTANCPGAETTVFAGMPLTKVRANARVELRAIARVGRGREHAKFSPVVVAAYHTEKDVVVDPEELAKLPPEKAKLFKESCPRKCFTQKGLYKYCEFCHRNAKELGVEKVLVVGNEPDEFVFTLETSGSLEAKKVLELALKELKKEAEAVSYAVKTFLE